MKVYVYSKNLRKRMTMAERWLWNNLKSKKLGGYKFRRQYVVGRRYIADFCCPTRKFIVEVDGLYHDTPKQRAYDIRRSKFIEAQGFKIYRVRNECVFNKREEVLEDILSEIENIDLALLKKNSHLRKH